MCAKTNLSSSHSLQNIQRQDIQLAQRMIMSAHMQQAIRLLQMPLMELENYIEEQIVDNPILELDGSNNEPEFEKDLEEDGSNDEEQEVIINDNDLSILSKLDEEWREHFMENEGVGSKRTNEEDSLKTYLEQSIAFEPSLHDQLNNQASETFESLQDKEIAQLLIGYIDRFGFLTTDLHEISCLHHIEMDELKKILCVIQSFEPWGIGAATIQESLLIQLRCQNKENSLAYKIMHDHYDNLLHNQIPIIQKKLKCSFNDIQKAIDYDIAKLDVHPGTQYSRVPTQAIIPDATLRMDNEQLIVEVERDYLPSLKLNHRYLKMLEDPTLPIATKQFIKQHVFSAKWLMKNLTQRYSTLERIAQSLAKRQKEFFMQPNGQLVPLTMNVLAEELGLHESTIARTVANKYFFTPRGLFPFRTFFTSKILSEHGSDLSSNTIRETLIELIQSENKQHPLSDESLSLMLKNKGMICARRTVAKYRNMLQIGNTQQRKTFT